MLSTTDVNRLQAIEKHNFINDTVFRLKTVAWTANRFVKNVFSPVTKFAINTRLIHEPVIAFSESELWNASDTRDNWILTAGKIQNLRIAARRLDGIEVKANEVFSFWKHIGNPNIGQGYVIGREIREGCIVPTIAGGLCQLSNALYDAALKANFTIIERHKHTKVIEGSLAEQDRDATVKWNYVDLRFKSRFDFRIETELSSDKLIVSFRGRQNTVQPVDKYFTIRQSNKINDCYSCGNAACFKHPDRSSTKQEVATTTFILDEKWPEFDSYITSIATDSDYFIVPLKESRFMKTDRYAWAARTSRKTKATTWPGIYRAIQLRYGSGKKNVFEVSLQLDRSIAQAAARHIPIDSTHLVISQNLLPFLHETNVLGGRTFDVFMTRLPIEKLHERLDLAHSKYPHSPTLKDFRASEQLIKLENQALTKARKILTPHSEIADIFKNKVERLHWHIPDSTRGYVNGNKVLFPASAVGRKGAYEIRRLIEELHLNVVTMGRTIESEDFWRDLNVEKFTGNFEDIALVVYPAYIEHQPRHILKAVSHGIPVITTTACGLDGSDQIKVVPFGNFERLKHEVCNHLEKKL